MRTILPFSRANVRRHGFYLSHQFAIIGNASTGKTVLADKLVTAFPQHPIEHFSAGGLMRELADQAGQSMHRFAQHMRANPCEGHDEFVDSQVRRHMSRNRRSLDAHLPVFAPHAFIVYLKCSWPVCAERRAATKKKPVAQVLQELIERDRADQEKYAQIYPGSCWLETDFDYVIDTERNNEARTLDLFLEAYHHWRVTHSTWIITGDAIPVSPVAADAWKY